MVSDDIDRLAKSVSTLDTCLKSNAVVNNVTLFERERSLCAEIRHQLSTSDINRLLKGNKQIVDRLLDQAFALLFELSGNPRYEDLRVYAEESIDAITRNFLPLNSTRVINNLISELNRSGHARSVAGAFRRLTSVIHLANYTRIRRFAVHILTVIPKMLAMNADPVFNALINNVPSLFKIVFSKVKFKEERGPWENIYVCICDKHLKQPGLQQKCAVLMLSELSKYFESVARRVYINCLTALAIPNESMVTAQSASYVCYLQILKGIWNTLLDSFPDLDNYLTEMLRGLLLSLLSDNAEVIVASIQLLCTIFNNPLKTLSTFDPSISASPITARSSGSCSDSSSTEVTSEKAEPSDQSDCLADEAGEIGDPLMQPELYEKTMTTHENGKNEKEKLPNSPKNLPTGLCAGEVNFCRYTSALLASRFLLTGINLKSQREVRVSHKILAINCLTAIATQEDISDVMVQIGGNKQPLIECCRFVLHEDPSLSSAAVLFIFGISKYKVELKMNFFDHILHSENTSVQFSLITASIENQKLLQSYKCLERVIKEACKEVRSSYIPLRIACAEFLSSLEWFKLPNDVKHLQENCLLAYFDLLRDPNPSVTDAAISFFKRLVYNSDFSDLHHLFIDNSLLEPYVISHTLPPVLGVPSCYNFCSPNRDEAICHNLEYILNCWVKQISSIYDGSIKTWCIPFLEEVVSGFPVSCYYDAYNFLTCEQPCGFITWILDICETSCSTAEKLASAIRLIGKLYAGESEYKLMRGNELSFESTDSDRLLLLLLRVINMYYSLVVKRHSTLSQSTSNILARATLSPAHSKKSGNNRFADISRLIGVNVSQSRNSSFYSSEDLIRLLASIEGAFDNFLGDPSDDVTERFLNLLNSAMFTLGVVCETVDLTDIRPLLPELCLYLKMLIDISPTHCAALIHQLLKVVFAKNLKSAKLNLLSSKFDTQEIENLQTYVQQVHRNFGSYLTLMLNPEKYNEYLDRELLWMREDSFSPSRSSSFEVAESLNLFNGLVTKLRQIYIPYESVDCRKIILNILCELLRGGVKYKLIDPQNTLKETIIAQVRDSYCSNKELAKEMALYFVFLSRFEGVPSLNELEQLVIDHLRVISSDLFSAGLEFLRIVILDFLFVRSKANKFDDIALSSLFSKLNDHLPPMLKNSLEETLHLLTLRLQAVRSDVERWKSTSEEYCQAFCHCWFTSCDSCNLPAVLDFLLSLHKDTSKITFKGISNYLERNSAGSGLAGRNVVQRVLPLVLFAYCTDPLADDDMFNNINSQIEQQGDVVQLEEFLNNGNTQFLLLAVIYLSLKENRGVQHQGLLSILRKWTENWDPSKIYWLDHAPAAYLWTQLTTVLDVKAIKVAIEVQSSGNHLESLKTLLPIVEETSILTDWRKEPSALSIEHLMTTNPLNKTFTDCDFGQIDSSLREKVIATLQYIGAKLKLTKDNLTEYNKIVQLSQQTLDELRCAISKSNSIEAFDLQLVIFSQLQSINKGHNLSWVEARSSVETATFLHSAAIYVMAKKEIPPFLVSGLTFWFQLPSVVEMLSGNVEPELLNALREFICKTFVHIQNSPKAMESKSGLQQLEFDNLERISNSYKQFPGGIEGIITEIYQNVQCMATFLRKNGAHKPELTSFIRSIIRSPLLNSMALIPVGLNEPIRVRLNAKDEITFPLIQIHNLCHVDVLVDFAWRINWLGWGTKKQYEEFWMSLLGVLSSTPSGSELTDRQGSSMAEQILYSSAAVTAITDILLYTRLFPQPGNVGAGVFAVKHREQNNTLYKSKVFEQIQAAEARLRKDPTPATTFLQNLEKQKYNGHYYELNQLSALSLWTLCGEIKSSKPPEAVNDKIKPSVSLFLIEATEELDVASSVNALFLNYSHWFEKGIETVPQPLLSATIRSMALLSDLFDNLEFFRTLYVQLKNVIDGGFFTDYIDLGYVIYGLLKAITIIGVDTFGEPADVDKMVLAWVEAGLTSRMVFVREATLQGYSYLLQSMNIDLVRSVSQYVNGFLLAELESFHPIVDKSNPKSKSFNSSNYFTLVWSLSFRCMQQPLQLRFAEDVLAIIRRCFTSRDIAKSHIDLITSGIQDLMLHSTSFTEMNKIEDLYRDIFSGYSTKSYRFIHALRIFNVAVFTGGLLASDDNKAIYFHEDMEKLLSIYKRTDVHAEQISLVLTPLLSFLYTDEVVFKKLLDFCTPTTEGFPNNLGHSLRMLSEFVTRFRSTSRLATAELFEDRCLELAKELISGNSDENTLLGLCLVIATNRNVDVVHRLPDFTERMYKQSLSREERDWLKIHLLNN